MSATVFSECKARPFRIAFPRTIDGARRVDGHGIHNSPGYGKARVKTRRCTRPSACPWRPDRSDTGLPVPFDKALPDLAGNGRRRSDRAAFRGNEIAVQPR